MSRRSPRETRRPVSGTIGWSLFVVLIALGLGLLILDQGFDGDTAVSAGPAPTTAPTTTVPEETTTTTIQKTGFKVVVANGSGVAGAATRMSAELQSQGFILEPATNADRKDYATTTVYYLTGFDAQATGVAQAIGAGASVAPLPAQSPVPQADIKEASVIVVLGRDLATTPADGSTTTGAPATNR